MPRLSISVLGWLTALAVAGCSLVGGGSPSPSRTSLTVGLGYLPSVQFAQFYRAQQQGYYAAAGLDVTFEHRFDYDILALVGEGTLDLGMSDGTSVIAAAGQGYPVRYAASIYARFPSVVYTAADSGVREPADLEGKRIGIPGRFGSSWVMLQALLASAGLSPDDAQIVLYPDFGQAVALREGQVDAATGFANNEPIQLARAGFPVHVMRIDDITPLPGPGLTVGEETLAERGAALRAFVAATLRAMTEIAAEPELGLEDSIAVVPDLAQDRDGQLAVLEATIEMWHSPYTEANGLGTLDADAWSRSIDFMRSLPDAELPADMTADQLLTEELLP
jgi:NitT/TauT family transport system substrate-binding protein